MYHLSVMIMEINFQHNALGSGEICEAGLIDSNGLLCVILEIN